MKTLIAMSALIFASVATAQMDGMTPEMQQMMQKNLGQLQQCFAHIDHKALENLRVRTEKVESEVKRLCAAGQRDAAQEKATTFGLEISKDPELQKIQKCGESLQGMQLPGELLSRSVKDGAEAGHICDI